MSGARSTIRSLATRALLPALALCAFSGAPGAGDAFARAAFAAEPQAPEASEVETEASEPAHYIFFGFDRERIHEEVFLESGAVAGAQLKYTWAELEPERDRYDFGALREDLAFLEAHGKKLFVQLQDLSFVRSRSNVPDYLRGDPAFHGGVAAKYERVGETDSTRFDGWVARRWDPAVQARFAKLLEAMAAEFDGRIAGVNFAETAIGFEGEQPEGFTPETYTEAIRQTLTAACEAFRESHVIAYANFMPGDSDQEARGHLEAIYRHAKSVGAGVGGPDLLPHRRWQRLNSYRLIAAREAGTVAGLAVQDGNLAQKNPDTGEKVTARELMAYAREDLRLDFVFWGTQEPHFSREVMPFLESLATTESAR